MTNESNSGPKDGEETDPLSATAMFFRTLDQQAGGKPAEPAAEFDFGLPGPAAGGRETPPAGPQCGSEKGEFTAIFGNRNPAALPPAPPSASPKSAPSEAWPEQQTPAKPGQGEFTRIFVKGASATPKPAATPQEPAPEAAVPRAKGFSSPGVSDAASAEAGFSQFFKPVDRVDAPRVQPIQPSSAPPLRPETPRASSTSDPFRSDSPFETSSANKSTSLGQDPQSITSLIQSLSSQSSSGAGSRVSDPAPYRSESQVPFQPVAKPSAPPEFESGGVTQFIQRLAEMPHAPIAEAPMAPPNREQDTGPGEYTRIISASNRPAASVPSAAAPVAAPAAPPAPAFVRPILPPLPVVPAIPSAPPIAPHPAPVAAVQAPAIPAPHLPPMPAPPAVAAPKGKLEALVPMLLVVNTFLLVVILVVMIFLIKGK